MLKFLRYNSRHCLWFPRGYKGARWPQLNPISSSSHGANGKRTLYLHEPGWLFRLRQRAFAFAGVRNASEGAIKFYKQHAPEHPSQADQDLFAKAVRMSNDRFRARFAAG